MADQEESLLQQLTEITQMMQEGQLVEGMAPEKKPQDEWKGKRLYFTHRKMFSYQIFRKEKKRLHHLRSRFLWMCFINWILSVPAVKESDPLWFHTGNCSSLGFGFICCQLLPPHPFWLVFVFLPNSQAASVVAGAVLSCFKFKGFFCHQPGCWLHFMYSDVFIIQVSIGSAILTTSKHSHFGSLSFWKLC